MFGFSYDKFEGMLTPWHWLDSLLCKLFGCPDRSYFRGGHVKETGIYMTTKVCCRCLKEKESNIDVEVEGLRR